MGTFFKTGDVKMPDEFTREVHAHELLLAFNGDVQCEAFIDWLNEHGLPSFREWTIKHGEDYE